MYKLFSNFLTALVVGIFVTLSASASPKSVILESFDGKNGELPKGWLATAGTWRIQEGALTADSLDKESFIWFVNESWQNYVIKVTATFVEVRDERRWLAVLFRGAKDGTQPWAQFTVRFNSTSRDGTEFAVKKDNGWRVRCINAASQDSVFGKPRKLRVDVRGSRVKTYLDGELVIESHFCVERNAGCVGLGVSGCLAKFDDFSIKPIGEETPEYKRQNPNPCDVIAHRGFSSIAPENTLIAINKAAELKAEYCEFDVRRCADNTLIVIHDEDVDRTSNGKGKVSELNYSQIKTFDAGSWKSEVYTGERIPTLKDALTALKNTGCKAVIELKSEGIFRDIAQAIEELEMSKQILVVSFDAQALKKLHRLNPGVNCGLLCGCDFVRENEYSPRRIARQARFCHAKVIGVEYNVLSPMLVEELKKHGLVVWAWTVNDPDVMAALINWDIDGVVTDRPDVLLQVSKNL